MGPSLILKGIKYWFGWKYNCFCGRGCVLVCERSATFGKSNGLQVWIVRIPIWSLWKKKYRFYLTDLPKLMSLWSPVMFKLIMKSKWQRLFLLIYSLIFLCSGFFVSIVCNYYMLVVGPYFSIYVLLFNTQFYNVVTWKSPSSESNVIFPKHVLLTLTLTINPWLGMTVLQAGFLINTCASGFFFFEMLNGTRDLPVQDWPKLVRSYYKLAWGW